MQLTLPRNSCSWGIGLADSFRQQSKKCSNGTGTNLQNPTKAICKIYEPDEGKIFCQADQAGAEALIVAYLCKPGPFRNLFLQGIKPHVFVALHNFRKQFEDVLGHNLQEFIELDAAGLRAHKNFKSSIKQRSRCF